MTAQVISLREPARPDDRETLLEAVAELHALVTLDPVLGASPVRVYFVFNPDAQQRIAASLGRAIRRPAVAYGLIAYDFPFALHLLQATASRLTRERAMEIASCSAGLQAECLRVAAATLGIDASPVPGFDAAALKSLFFASTQETVIQLLALDLAA
jgi:3-hydroxypropanoate dehydrogenase